MSRTRRGACNTTGTALLLGFCALIVLAGAACSPRYRAEPPAYLAGQIRVRPPQEGTVTLYPTNGPYGGTPALDFAQVGETVFAATGHGLYRSDEAGQTWQLSAGKPEAPIVGLASLPQSLIAAAPPNLYRSDDRGDSWQRITPESGACGMTRHSVAVVGPQLFYACNGIVFRSDDGGTSWLSHQMIPSNGPQISELFVADDTLFGVAPNFDAFWRIENWPPQPLGLRIDSRLGIDFVEIVSFDGTLVAVSPSGLYSPSPSTSGQWALRKAAPEGWKILAAAVAQGDLLVATNGGIFRRKDLVKDWGPPEMEGEPVNLIKVLTNPDIPSRPGQSGRIGESRVYASASSGILVPERAGGAWVLANEGIIGGIRKLGSSQGGLFALSQTQLLESSDFGESWLVAKTTLPGERFHDVSADGGRLFLSSDRSLYLRDTSKSWQEFKFLQGMTDMSPSVILHGQTLFVSPSSSFGASAVRRTDSGTSSEEVAGFPRQARALERVRSEDSDREDVWLAYHEGGLSLSQDIGLTWKDLASNTLLQPDVRTSYLNGSRLFSGSSRGTISAIDLEDVESGWSLVVAKPTIGDITALWIGDNSIREKIPQVIIAGTNTGLYVTDDGGEDFQKVDTIYLPIPFERVNSLDYTNGHLLIATDAGVFYGVDQISRPWPENMSMYVIWSIIGVLVLGGMIWGGIDERRQRTAREAAMREVEEKRKAIEERVRVARENMSRVLRMREGSFNMPGLSLAHRLKQSEDISGDFYNVVPRGDGSLGIYLVDIEGHGILASQTAQSISDILYDSSLDWGKGEPRHELEVADREVFERLGDRRVAVTMCFADVDPFKGIVRFANAGMPLPLLFRRDEALPEELRAAGAYVGAGYAHRPVKPIRAETRVGNGDLLVLFSDGIIEAQDTNGNLFGSAGVVGAVAVAGSREPEEVAEAILAAVREHTGRDEPTDDQTLIVVLVEGEHSAGTAAPATDNAFQVLRSDAEVLEIRCVKGVELADRIDSGELGATLEKWLEGISASEQFDPVFSASYEALLNTIKHGCDPGDQAFLEFTNKPGGAIELEIVQQKEWPEWYRWLGDRRRAERISGLGEWSGTAGILDYTDRVDGASSRGRRLHFWFALKPSPGSTS